MSRALSLNPWEPTYLASEAAVLAGAAGHAGTSVQVTSDLVLANLHKASTKS